MRPAPKQAPAPITKPAEVEERSYEFISPVFGGGVSVQGHKKPFDRVTPIRVASVRGQLRFWWRACNPRECTTVQALRAAEAEVFGSTDLASALAIAVIKQPGAPSTLQVLQGPFGSAPGMREVAYGAFPLRDTTKSNDHGTLHQYKESWTLAFDFHEGIRPDVEAALWAWAHFGGLGGRTRRGFGAIAQIAPKPQSIEAGWPAHVNGLEVPWPHLRKDREKWLRFAVNCWEEGIDAQKFLLGRLQRIRQGPIGRKKDPEQGGGSNHPGRSYWPEPDAIRQVTGQCSRRHGQAVTTVASFPRAAFGSPVIFHFKDAGDPTDSTLAPRGKGRLASPLVLRPHRRPDGRVEALALVLGHPAPRGGHELQWGMNNRAQVRTDLTEQEAANLGAGGRPLVKDGQVYTDPLERFLEEIT